MNWKAFFKKFNLIHRIPYFKKLDLTRWIPKTIIGKRLLYMSRTLTMVPERYRNLLKIVYEERCQRIMEIGTFNGVHAYQMIVTSNIFHPMNQIEYYGFDLFEILSDEDWQREFTKKPPSHNFVQRLLERTGANIHLFMGYSKDTLPLFIEELKNNWKQIDLVFIDGGHSIETITSDWNHVKEIITPNTIVIFDDYFNNIENEVKGVGCQSLIDALDKNIYSIEFLKPEDHFKKEWGILKTNMVKVRLKKAMHS